MMSTLELVDAKLQVNFAKQVAEQAWDSQEWFWGLLDFYTS